MLFIVLYEFISKKVITLQNEVILNIFPCLVQGFTYPVQHHFLESILETLGYQLTPHNQIDDFGVDKMWKMSKQSTRKRKSRIFSAVEVFWFLCCLRCLYDIVLVLIS